MRVGHHVSISVQMQHLDVRKGDRFLQTSNSCISYEQPNIDPDAEPQNIKYALNRVISSSYTWYNFLPKNIFEQFHALSNCYFFLIGILQLIKIISATAGNPDMWYTLFFIMAISAARAAVEDRGRHQADVERNSCRYEVLGPNGIMDIKSGEIEVGQVVKVNKNQMIPADMLFLASSSQQGQCFIDRANLNGETQLEVFSSLQETRRFFSEEGLAKGQSLEIALNYEPENKRFDEFRGQMEIKSDPVSRFSVDGSVLLMRETNLRNTECIFGLVVYTGNDTKIQMSNNSGEKNDAKRSQIFLMVERLMIGLFLTQMVCCIVGGIISGFASHFDQNKWYLRLEGDNIAVEAFYRVLTWIQILCQMVPISLILTGEMVHFIQAMFMQWDKNLYYGPINKRARVNRATIHEDLGLVDYVFSDKTGTLTQNKMEFRYMKVRHAGEFGSKETEIARAVQRRLDEVSKSSASSLASSLGSQKSGTRESLGDDTDADVRWTTLESPLHHDFSDDKPSDCCAPGKICSWFGCCWNGNRQEKKKGLEQEARVNEFSKREIEETLKVLWGSKPVSKDEDAHRLQVRNLRNYMVHMALSSTIKPYTTNDGTLEFQAESAEEFAMVRFARTLGFTLLDRSPTVLEVIERDEQLNIIGKKKEEYGHLATFAFTSARARVTVIYQKTTKDGETVIQIMSKGQDTVILPLLDNSEEEVDMLSLESELNNLCANGLRTLVCADGQQTTSWWEKYADRYTELISTEAGDDPEGLKKRKHDFFEEVEKDAGLKYLGLMGLEDQLQLLVPETIQDCLRADVKVWMITGDKLETARNIGLACNLIDSDMQINFKKEYTLEQCIENFQKARLVEVTGAWANLTSNDAELAKIFELFDTNDDGKLLISDMMNGLQTLQYEVQEKQLKELEEYQDPNGEIGPEEFRKFMKSSQFSMLEAVKFDVVQGWQTYKSLEDPKLTPISMLVNRDAFKVLFPEIGGGGIKNMEELEELRDSFFALAAVSKSVVFARAQPAMKKKMVTEIQNRVPGCITLAIGDGANDVDMITAAHVGVGIAGVEGTGAVNSADYAIGTFRMLHTLLFVHGFWSYRRISYMVNFLCYKAVFFAVPCFIFGFHSRFSAERLWDGFNYFCFNLFFTSTPVMGIAIMDQALPREILQNNVAAFREQRKKRFTKRLFFLWILRAFVHGSLVYFITYKSIEFEPIGPNGQMHDLKYFSLVQMITMSCIVTMMSLFDCNYVTFINWITLVICSIGSIFVFNILHVYVILMDDNSSAALWPVLGNFQFWLILFLCMGCVTVFELSVRAAKIMFRPSLANILSELNSKTDNQKDKLKLSDKAQIKWRKRKKQHKVRMRASVKLPTMSDDQMKGVVRVMMRFRHLTGAQFESADKRAASHVYQNHDDMNVNKNDEEKKEERAPIVQEEEEAPLGHEEGFIENTAKDEKVEERHP